MPEFQVRCHLPEMSQGGNETLRFDVDGKTLTLSLKLSGLNRRLLQRLPDRALDLLEIASFVYGLDSAVSRGGLRDRSLGADWYRSFYVTVPVRDLGHWRRQDVSEALAETLFQLSNDHFVFNFEPQDDERVESGWFALSKDDGWQADRVLMFSGGLDSYAGALAEIVEQENKVALVSHQSSTKLSRVQTDLVKDLRSRYGADACRHFPLRVQLAKGAEAESTHRTRSFLFAAIGQATALAFGTDRVSFHENGIVSLNLPPINAVVGTKATRTTHPQVLRLYSDLMSLVFGGQRRVDNPFFWRTKTEVLETIARLGAADQIAVTSSCADTHNRTIQHPHCGRCSQCIDRRFAVLAAGLERYDPSEAYAIDLLNGPRKDVRDREMGLSYMRNAVAFEAITPEQLLNLWPEIVSSVDHLDRSHEEALKSLCALINRHGRAVAGVIREMKVDVAEPDSLPALFGQITVEAQLSTRHSKSEPEKPGRVTLLYDKERRLVTLADHIKLRRSATAVLLIALAEEHLRSAGQGRDHFDYLCTHPLDLCEALKLESDDGVRQTVSRARTMIKKRMISAGYEEDATEIIENIPGQGYRLDPERVIVRKQGH